MGKRGHIYSAAEKKRLKEAYIEALGKTGGLTMQAAQMAGIGHRATVIKWKHDDPAFAEAVDAAMVEAREKTLDMAENALLRAIQAGDFQAIKFFLKCKGRERGYDLRQEIDINATVNRPRIIFEDEERDDDALQD